MSGSAWVLLAALAAPSADGLAIRRGDVVAVPRLHIPDEGASPGRAVVRVEIAVSGPAGLAVEPPRLEDALSAWRVTGRSSSWREADGRAFIDLSLTLEQVKPGVVTLPGIVLRARSGGAWEEFSWPDLLHESKDVPDPDFQERLPPSPWPARLAWGALAVAVALASAFVVRAVLRRPRRTVPLHVRALASLEGASRPPGEQMAHLDSVVRGYLDERFGLATRRQTASEMRHACAGLPAEVRDALEGLTRSAELAKYAGVVPGEDERRHALALARGVIESCAALSVSEEAGRKENVSNGGGG